ncbi:MAG: tyrosine-type recombinase/integrase [Planctomycetota bacterium]|nr:tyrosine-type recombinase/integrase [Planctomycetota bacterium]
MVLRPPKRLTLVTRGPNAAYWTRFRHPLTGEEAKSPTGIHHLDLARARAFSDALDRLCTEPYWHDASKEAEAARLDPLAAILFYQEVRGRETAPATNPAVLEALQRARSERDRATERSAGLELELRDARAEIERLKSQLGINVVDAAWTDALADYLKWGRSCGGKGGRPWSVVHSRMTETRLTWWGLKLVMPGLSVITLAKVETALAKVKLSEVKLALADAKMKLSKKELARKKIALAKMNLSEKELVEVKTALAKTKLSEITLAMVETALATTPGAAVKTRHDYAATLKGFLNWDKKHDLLAGDPLKNLGKQDAQVTEDWRALNPDEIKRLLAVAPDDRKVWYVLAATTGLRIGEIGSLRVRNLDVVNFCLRPDTGGVKNRKKTAQPLPQLLTAKLAGLASGKKPDDLLVPIPNHYTERVWEDFDAADIHDTPEGLAVFHSLRKSFVTLTQTLAGASLVEAQKLARHSTPTITANTYTRGSDARLSSLVDDLAGKLLA